MGGDRRKYRYGVRQGRGRASRYTRRVSQAENGSGEREHEIEREHKKKMIDRNNLNQIGVERGGV